MAPPEKPKSSVERPKQPEVLPAFVQRSSDVADALDVPDKESWRQMMDLVRADLSLPQASVSKGDVLQFELTRRYMALSEMRMQTAKGLLAPLAFVDKKMALSPVQQATVLRTVAKYVDERDIYEHMHKGRKPSGSPLPEYLAKYVKTREIEEQSVRVTEKMLPLQYDVQKATGLKDSPRELAPQTTEIVMAAVRLRLSMDYLLPCVNAGANAEPCTRLLEAAGFAMPDGAPWPQETIDSVRFLAGYMAKYQDTIQQYADLNAKDKKISNMTIAEALDCCAQGSVLGTLVEEVAVNAKGLLNGNLPDMRSFAKNLFLDKDMLPDRMAEVMLAPLEKLSGGTEEERGVFRKDAAEVIKFFRGFEADKMSIERLPAFIQNFNESQKRMIMGVCDGVSKQETVDRLSRVTFMSMEPEDATNKLITAKLNELIVSKKMSARDAFDMYYLMETRGGDLLLAYKAVALLDKYGESKLAIELQLRVMRRLVNLATSDTETVEKELKELGYNEEFQRELMNVREYLAESGVDALGHWWNRWVSFVTNFPELGIPMSILAISGVAGVAVTGTSLAIRGYTTMNVTALEKFSKMGISEIRTKFNLPMGVTDEKIMAAQQEVTKILGEYDRLGRRFHWPLEGGRMVRNAKAIVQSVPARELSNMAKALKTRYSDIRDVARILGPATEDSDALRKALKGAGYNDADIAKAVSHVEALQRRAAKTVGDASPNATVGAGAQAGVDANVDPTTGDPNKTPGSDPNSSVKGKK